MGMFEKFLATGLMGAAMASAQAAVPVPVASYSFNGTLAADQAGAPALTAIDPQGANGFETATVGGVSRTVYRWSDLAGGNQHGGGLQLSTHGLLSDAQSYTLALNFEFGGDALGGGGWRRIVDTEARQSDNGFYVAPPSWGHVLHVVQGAESPTPAITNGVHSFTTPGFHWLWLTVQGVSSGQQQVQAWMDGQLELTVGTTTFGLGNANNPQGLLTFFADNLAAGSQQEYANGRIASLALYDGAVSPSAVPEPQAAWLLAAGLAVLALKRGRAGAVRNVTRRG